MVQTKSFKSVEEAAEAWNTWAGGCRIISRESFNKLNEAIERDYPIENGVLVLPDGENAFGDLEFGTNGVYEHPWPKIYLSDFNNAEFGLFGSDDMFQIYKLRARWRLVCKNHSELRHMLMDIIVRNDRNNYHLNQQIKVWNDCLANSGFPQFIENDLRGADLTGLEIMGTENHPVFLRKILLDYSECHLLKLRYANLYEANLRGIKAANIDLSFGILHGTSIVAAYLPDGCFLGADLGYANLSHSLLSHCVFDGANCYKADFSSTLCLKTSFCSYYNEAIHKNVYSNLNGVRWNGETRFIEVAVNEFLKEQNQKLDKHIESVKKHPTTSSALASAIDFKPGILAFQLISHKRYVFSFHRLSPSETVFLKGSQRANYGQDFS